MIDYQKLKTALGGNSKLLHDFLTECCVCVQSHILELESACREGDIPLQQQVFHKMAGLMSHLHSGTLNETLAEIKPLIGQSWPEFPPTWLIRLKHANQMAYEDIQAFLLRSSK